MTRETDEGRSVLVVDDEPIVCRRVGRALGNVGFDVTTTESPETALAAITARTFDIVVTDVVMGDVDGIQILRHALQKSARCRVIIITAFATRDLAREAMRQGAFGFIAKPFAVSEIRAIVGRAAESLRDEDAGSPE